MNQTQGEPNASFDEALAERLEADAAGIEAHERTAQHDPMPTRSTERIALYRAAAARLRNARTCDSQTQAWRSAPDSLAGGDPALRATDPRVDEGAHSDPVGRKAPDADLGAELQAGDEVFVRAVVLASTTHERALVGDEFVRIEIRDEHGQLPFIGHAWRGACFRPEPEAVVPEQRGAVPPGGDDLRALVGELAEKWVAEAWKIERATGRPRAIAGYEMREPNALALYGAADELKGILDRALAGIQRGRPTFSEDDVAVTLVRQKHQRGCGIACVAMLTGEDYDTLAAEVEWRDDQSPVGFYVDDQLWRRGYAICRVYERGSTMWPPLPFARVHLCNVDYVTDAPVSHNVVMLADGSVLDPMHDEPRRLSDYPRVYNVAAVVTPSEVGIIEGQATDGGQG